ILGAGRGAGGEGRTRAGGASGPRGGAVVRGVRSGAVRETRGTPTGRGAQAVTPCSSRAATHSAAPSIAEGGGQWPPSYHVIVFGSSAAANRRSAWAGLVVRSRRPFTSRRGRPPSRRA